MSYSPKTRHKSKSDLNFSSPLSSVKSIIVEPSSSFFPSKDELLRLLAVLAIASSVALSCNFLAGFMNRQPKPFCDSTVDYHDFLSDVCQPCPINGECDQGRLECVRGFTRHGNLCVEDGEISETAKKLSKWIENRLCEAYSKFLCDGIGTVWAREEDVWKDLDEHELMEKFGLENAIYLYGKQRAMEIVGKLLETRTGLHGIKELKCPESLAEGYKPFNCRIRQWALKHVRAIMSICALFVGGTILLSKIHRRRYLSTRVDEIYHQVCDILEENALTSVNGECEPWVVASRLRDHLLFPRERKDPVLWKKVEELVQEDSRVDRYPKLVKGESKVVWEWQVEGSLSSSRVRKSGEASKLKSTEGKTIKSDHQKRVLKAEAKELIF